MNKFYKVRKGFKYTGKESLSNLDFWYGPWESINDFKREILGLNSDETITSTHEELLLGKITPGFTIGIYNSVSGDNKNVREYWWQRKENFDGSVDSNYSFIEKIEKYELVLNKFEATVLENSILLTYNIGGKGLLPKVNISGTNELNKSVNFGQDVLVNVPMTNPGIYTFEISVSDVLGTPFVVENENISKVISASWGDLIAKATRTTSLDNLKPLQILYEEKSLGILVEYNKEKVENVEVWLYGYDLGQDESLLTANYRFYEDALYSGRISTTIVLPKETEHPNCYRNINNIYATYTDKQTHEFKKALIYSFNILRLGLFALNFPNEIPEVGYSGTSLSLDINLLYGGDIYGLDPVIDKLIEITLDGEHSYSTKIYVNTTKNVVYPLPEFVFLSDEDYQNKTLKIQIIDDIYVEKVIRIKLVTNPQIPYGEAIYFNSNYRNVVPFLNYHLPFADSRTNKALLPLQGENLIWNSDEEVLVLKIENYHFNLDLSIRTSQSGENEPLIIIERNNKDNLLTIGKLLITSDYMFNKNGKEYQTNNLALPCDNDYVHIGFGYLRVFMLGNTPKYYNCIFINGEIAFCSDTTKNKFTSDKITIKFNNTFSIKEFSLSVGDTSDSITNCIGAGGNKINTYNLIEKSLYDVFYYNWLTTLPPNTNLNQQTNLTLLELVPFMEPENSNTDPWWNSLRNSLDNFGSNIKSTYDKKDLHWKWEFVKFGEINHGETKLGIEKTYPKRLFEFSKGDKETLKLDKVRGVICKYRFVKGLSTIYNDNKYCIVQVLGTSTLTYPVPNFLFTFIKYENGEFSLDDTIPLSYISPTLGNISNNEELVFTEEQVDEETNLVAKADSMDSAHLNNTPTCVYFNSLVNALNSNNDINEFDSFSKFDENYLDAIVGSPILLKIDTRDGANIDKNVQIDDNINYNSYGTFMFNIGKSANAMGLNDSEHPIFSLEGQSNEDSEILGSPGLFTLPTVDIEDLNRLYTNEQKTLEEKEQIILNNRIIVNAFNKLELSYEQNDVIVQDNQLTNSEKSIIINYLINSLAFESRSNIIEDDHITDIDNHWNDYALPILRMWLFVNRAEGSVAGTNFYDYFDKVFNKNYAILYYINLILFGQADNLGKNMMIDCKLGEKIWYIRPYDLDSEFGLTNNGFDNFPVYSCISREHFEERYGRPYDLGSIPTNTFGKYNSASSRLWTKFWKAFKNDIVNYYSRLRRTYVTPERIISIGENLVNNLISKEQYNIDFSLKHLGTEFSYLNKGGRFLNYKDWVIKRFMYVDSYFSYFTRRYDESGYDGYTWTIGKTLVPIFYDANLQEAKTRYGYKDFTYNEPLNGNMQYVFNIVPEAVLSMSPIWGRIKEDVDNGLYPNLQKYSGGFDSNLFAQNNGLNLREIEILVPGSDRLELGNEILNIPNSVRILKLEKINASGELINLGENTGLEELYIHNCNIGSLTLSRKSSLKKLVITSDSSQDHSNITTLQLSELVLSELSIDCKTYIGSLSIEGRITVDDIINLSGILCGSLSLNNCSDLKELYLDLLYDLNGTIVSPYDFNKNGLNIVETHYEHNNGRATNLQLNEEYIYLYFNYNDETNYSSTNFNRISPKISQDSNSSILDLGGCTNLEKLSCIGFTELKELKDVPNTIKCLNILFCLNLTKLNCTIENEEYFDFNGFTNLYCNDFTVIGREYKSGTNEYNLYYYYSALDPDYKLGPSFNLLGCKAVTKIKNLRNLNKNFTGSYFLDGCMALSSCEDCNITFTTLYDSFKFTEVLPHIPSGFNFNLAAGIDATGAFLDSLIPVSEALNLMTTSGIKLKALQIGNANLMFVRVIDENLGSENEPLIINWTGSCASVFSKPIYNPNSISHDYESFCIESISCAKNKSSSIQREVYIKLPNTTSVYRMFMDLSNVLIKNNDVFKLDNQYNTNLTNADCFVSNTKQNMLFDFTGCTKLNSLRFCYAKTKIDESTVILQGCNLPINLNINIDITGLFKDTNLENVDVKNIFSGIHITRASGCFINSKCNCTGSPFGNIGNRSINISAMFGTDIEINPGIISDLSWITPNMTTSDITLNNYDSLTETVLESRKFGVFQGKIIENFETINCDSGSDSSLRKMFKDSIISTIKENFTEFLIKASDSTSIFENTFFLQLQNDPSLQIIINNTVKNLTKGFSKTNGKINITIDENSNIRNLSYCFNDSRGTITINSDINENRVYFPMLEDISYMFFGESGVSPNGLPELNNVCVLFKGCNNLKNLNYFFKDNKLNFKFDFTGCDNILTMNYAFCNSGIENIPAFPQKFNLLKSIKGIFRRILLKDNLEAITINAPMLENADEAFAETKHININNNLESDLLININSNSLSNINAFSTNTHVKLVVLNLYSSMFALLPETILEVELNSTTPNYMGGSLDITGNGEESKFLTYTNGKWYSITSTRQQKVVDNYYILNNI